MKWLKNWLNRHSSACATSSPSPGQLRTSRKKQNTGYQPQVEQLEEKVLLSVFSPTYVSHSQLGHGIVGPLSGTAVPSSAQLPRNFATPMA